MICTIRCGPRIHSRCRTPHIMNGLIDRLIMTALTTSRCRMPHTTCRIYMRKCARSECVSECARARKMRRVWCAPHVNDRSMGWWRNHTRFQCYTKARMIRRCTRKIAMHEEVSMCTQQTPRAKRERPHAQTEILLCAWGWAHQRRCSVNISVRWLS